MKINTHADIPTHPTFARAYAIFGAQGEMARVCKVTPVAVCRWRWRGIPTNQLAKLAKAARVSITRFDPSLSPYLARKAMREVQPDSWKQS